jgi:hypothetical protein
MHGLDFMLTKTLSNIEIRRELVIEIEGNHFFVKIDLFKIAEILQSIH